MDKNEEIFYIRVRMRKEWTPVFLAFLKQMERYGNLGHSEIIGFMSDGDGEFRPKFEVSINGSSTTGLRSFTPLFNVTPAQYRRLKDDGEPIKYFDLG